MNKKINVHFTIFGLPILILATCVGIGFLTKSLFIWMIASIPLAHLYKKHYLSDFVLTLDINKGMSSHTPMYGTFKLMIQGLPADFIYQSEQLIASNKTLKISVPNIKVLREALMDSIVNRGGTVDFKTSDRFKMKV